MALVEIPVPSNSESFRQRTVLDGTTYELIFSWSIRAQQFTLSINDAQGTRLISIPVVGGVDLLTRFRRTDLPQGNLIVFDTTDAQREPTLEGFGAEFRVWYQEAA